MKLHTNIITQPAVYRALNSAILAGRISEDIYFVKLDPSPSRSRHYGYEIQLGTDDKTSGPTRSRHFKNRGNAGADSVYAATYAEWGWFIAELFVIDPAAVFGSYRGVASFNEQTENKFVL